jgi:hypothetical protein
MTAPKVEAALRAPAGSNPCKLTECQGKPRCPPCALMDRADAHLAGKEPPKPQAPAVAVPAEVQGDEDIKDASPAVLKALVRFWRKRCEVLATPQPPAQPQAHADLREALRNTLLIAETLDKRPRPLCRDCADNDGVCPTTGMPCDTRAVFAAARAALSAPPPAQGDALREALQEAECALSLMVSYGHCEGDREVGRDAAQVRAVDALPRIAAALSSPSPAASAEGKKSGAPSVRSRDEG